MNQRHVVIKRTFDYYCSSVKKEFKKRICSQYIPSAYKMKNHYKIHAEHYDDYDHDQDDILPSLSQDTNQTSNGFKTEIFDWLRPDLDNSQLDTLTIQTNNINKLNFKENKEQDWVNI